MAKYFLRDGPVEIHRYNKSSNSATVEAMEKRRRKWKNIENTIILRNKILGKP